MSESTADSASPGAPETAAALDLLLTQAALGPLRQLFPGRSALRFAAALASRPGLVAGRASSLAAELARVAGGDSAVAPAAKDRRFTDPAWTGNPVLHRVMQAYLATGAAARDLVEAAPLDWRDAERMRFAVGNLVDALAPSNSLLLSPEAWKAAIDSGGGSILTGARHLAGDLAAPPRVPSMVPPDAFTVGTDLAASPGAVVLRTPVYELIQYQPTTETVRELPLLIVPPTINKYYILDLAPGRSMIEYLTAQGQQVFVMSWRNPDERHAAWGFGKYTEAIIEAMHAVAGICSADAVHLLAACSGGILASLTAAVLADRSRAAAAAGAADDNPRLASLTLLVTMLDQARTDAVGALVDESTAQAAIAASARKGYLDGRRLAELFAWLRPGDLIWNYWVNNYLLGREPARFDILFWNADTTRMTAGLHRDFVRAAVDNALASPGGAHRSRHRDRLVPGRPGQLRGGGSGRPHLSLAVLLPRRPAARRQDPVRAVQQRAHRGARQPGGQQEVRLPGQRRRHRGRGVVAARGGRQAGIVVAGLRQLAGGTVRRPDPGAARAGRQALPGHRARPGQLRARRMRGRQADRVTMVTVGDRRLRAAIRPGTGGGPPLLVCNGIGTPLEALAPFTSVLDPAIEVVRFDVPGVGGSPVPRLPYTVQCLARLAAQMLGELGYDRFDAFGISWGGGLAQQLALQYPRRCRRLVLAATSTGSLMIPASPRVLRHLSSPRRHRDPAHAARIAGTIYGGALRDHPELAEPITLATPRPVSRRGYLYQLTASAGWTSLPVLRLIRQPTLILAGDDDPIIPLANAQADGRAAARRPAARLPGRSPRPAHQGRRARPRGQRFPALR